MFNIVLVEPEIPPNTGNIGRLCLATRSTLHLVKPLGFSLDDRQLRRAGLDYWHEVPLQLWDSFDALQRSQPVEARYFFLTTKTQFPYYRVNFRKNDFFVFGRETKGVYRYSRRFSLALWVPLPAGDPGGPALLVSPGGQGGPPR